LVAAAALAREKLNWKPRHSQLEQIVAHAARSNLFKQLRLSNRREVV
jgi:UDP-glucose 4-epimerase